MPSIGSMIHWRAESPVTPNSSPNTPSAGRSTSRIARIARSVARSASVTWLASALSWMSRSARVEASHGCRIRRIREAQSELEIGAQIPVEGRVE